MPIIDFIFDDDCPNIIAAREQLRSACANLGIPPQWNEWNRTAPNTPEHLQGFGSPTILVNGKDIAGLSPTGIAACCRIYPSSAGTSSGIPSLEMISAALTTL